MTHTLRHQRFAEEVHPEAAVELDLFQVRERLLALKDRPHRAGDWGLSTRYPASRTTTAPDALDIGQRRDARGAISQAVFLQAREALR